MNQSVTTGTASTDRDGLCQAVLEGFGSWIDEVDTESYGYVKYSLRRFIRRHLRTTSYRPFADTVSIPKRTATCDLVIDDRIGIKILYGLNAGSKEWIHKQLRSLFTNYDHLILYGHRILPEHLDIWYQIKRSLGRRSSRQKRIYTLQTVQQIEYRIPLTNRAVRKALVHKGIAYLLFVGFVFAGGQLLALTDGTSVMARSYVGALILFNVIVVLFGAFLVRTL